MFQTNKKMKKKKIENTTNSWINQPEENEDSASVKSNSTNEATKTDTQPKQSQPLDSKELKQLATMVSKYAISQDSNVKQQIEKQQKQLLQQGISQKY